MSVMQRIVAYFGIKLNTDQHRSEKSEDSKYWKRKCMISVCPLKSKVSCRIAFWTNFDIY